VGYKIILISASIGVFPLIKFLLLILICTACCEAEVVFSSGSVFLGVRYYGSGPTKGWCVIFLGAIKVKVKVTLRPTTSRSVSPGFMAHVGLTTGYLFLLRFTGIVLSIAGAPSDER
jgi:hypothetical protein